MRFLQAKISTVDFRCDPVDKLPFELCYDIFQYLDIYQIFQAQRVSRKWYQSLSSPKVIEPLALRPWFGDSEMSSRTSRRFLQGATTVPDGTSPAGEASLHAKHIDCFRNGTAISMATGKWQTQGRDSNILSHIDFAGSILTWTDRQVGCIRLKCMISGWGVSLFTPMKEEIRQIAISDSTVVAMTLSGKCCAWDLSDGLQKLAGRPPECIETHVVEAQITFVSGKTVAALYHVSDDIMMFTTWDIKAQQSHHFEIQINQGILTERYNYFVIITSSGQSIVFFERIFDKTNYVRFTRTNLKGEIESSGCMDHPEIQGYSMHSENAIPLCTLGRVTLWSYAGRRGKLDAQRNKAKPWEIIRVVYDTKADQLELQRHTVEQSIQTRFRAEDFLWCKDVAYFGNYGRNGIPELEVLDLKTSVCKKAEMSASTLVPEILESPLEDEEDDEGRRSFWMQEFFLLGNESFLVSVRYVYPIVRLKVFVAHCRASLFVSSPLHACLKLRAAFTDRVINLGPAITLSGALKK